MECLGHGEPGIPLDVARFLAQLAQPAPMPALLEKESLTSHTPCASCGATYAEIARTGLMGCAECYAHFLPSALAALRRLHAL